MGGYAALSPIVFGCGGPFPARTLAVMGSAQLMPMGHFNLLASFEWRGGLAYLASCSHGAWTIGFFGLLARLFDVAESKGLTNVLCVCVATTCSLIRLLPWTT